MFDASEGQAPGHEKRTRAPASRAKPSPEPPAKRTWDPSQVTVPLESLLTERAPLVRLALPFDEHAAHSLDKNSVPCPPVSTQRHRRVYNARSQRAQCRWRRRPAFLRLPRPHVPNVPIPDTPDRQRLGCCRGPGRGGRVLAQFETVACEAPHSAARSPRALARPFPSPPRFCHRFRSNLSRKFP